MDLVTQKSLLARLKAAPGECDWESFYAKYWAVILSFAQKQGLDEHAAQDVLQETMLVLMRRLPEFDYDAARGKFRNWLLTIVANKAREALRRSHADRHVAMDNTQSGSRIALSEKLASDLPAAADTLEASWRQSLLEEALRRIQHDPQTKPETLAAFRAYVIENRPVSEVAAQFGLKENAVYQIKNRMLNRLREELTHLEADCGTAELPHGTNVA